jgi:hypothetical protein
LWSAALAAAEREQNGAETQSCSRRSHGRLSAVHPRFSGR